MYVNSNQSLPNSRYFPIDTINQTNTSQLQSMSKEPKREALPSVPMVNNIGDENSFFNCIIHMLYFTPEILSFLRENKESFKKENSGYEILGELYDILDKYDKLLDKNQCYLISEDERFIDVKNIRTKISELYKGEGFFQMNNSDDPSEILYFFLNAIHSYSINLDSPKYYIIENHNKGNEFDEHKNNLGEKEDKCDPICLAHSLFDMHLIQQIECLNCKHSGNIRKFPNNFFIFDINYKNIAISTRHINKFKYLLNTFFRYAKKQFHDTNDQCPSQCNEPNLVNRIYALESSQYLVFNINWKEIKPYLQDVCKCYFMLSRVLHNNEIFDFLDKEKNADYSLYGFISYWNGHYISFYNNKYKEWYFYEDMNTRKMVSWKEVLIFCIKNHYHPIMLFYRKTEGKIAVYDPQIVEKDYIEIMNYCVTVDAETLQRNSLLSFEGDQITNLTVSLNDSLIRPTMQPNQTKDYDLIKTVENLQKLEEMKEKKQKLKYLDDMEKNGNESGMVPEGINIFAGKWICHQCHNHNNFSVYQCSKCQVINVKVFEIIYNTKNQKGSYRRNFKNNPSKFEKLTKNFEKNYSSLIKNKINLGLRDDQYEKIKTKRKEEEINLQIENEKKLNENKIKFIVNPDKTWTCIYCGFFNENINIDFCEKCKWNKPNENELIEINNEDNYISSMKQY